MKRFACLLAVSLFLASSGAVPALDSLDQALPASTLLYLSFRNPTGTEAFEESAPRRISQHLEMREFLDNLRGVYAQVREQYGPMAPVPIELIESLPKREISLAFTGMTVDEEGIPQPGPVLSFLFDGPAAEAKQLVLEALEALADEEPLALEPAFEKAGVEVEAVSVGPLARIHMGILNGRLLMTMNEATMRQTLGFLEDDEAQALAASPEYAKVMGEVRGAESFFKMYVNVQQLLPLVSGWIPQEPRAMLELYGLEEISAMGVGSRFADGGMKDAIYFFAPAPRQGLLVPPPHAVDLSLLRLVPRDAGFLQLGRLDLEKAYGALMDFMRDADPEEHQRMERQVRALEDRIGFRIQEDLLASLGSQYLFFTGPWQMVLMAEVEDQGEFEDCVQRLVDMAQDAMALNRLPYKGSEIRHLDFTGSPVPLSPSYTFHENHVVIGLYPQTVKAFLTHAQGGRPTALDNPDFHRVAQRFLDGADNVTYWNAKQSIAGAYDLAAILAQMLHGVQEGRFGFRPELLPHTSELEPYLFGVGSGMVSDREGVLYESHSPFGSLGSAAALVGSLRRSLDAHGVALPVFAGMLLPALARAREEARRAACKSNLMQIGVALAAYQGDHGWEMPPTLEDLVPEYIDSRVLQCPSLGEPESYAYVGPLPVRYVPPDTVIAYDRAGNHDGGRNCLHMDGAVAWVNEIEFAVKLQRNVDALRENAWHLFTPGQRERAERFYAGQE